jgi:hypothetical protein
MVLVLYLLLFGPGLHLVLAGLLLDTDLFLLVTAAVTDGIPPPPVVACTVAQLLDFTKSIPP